MTGNLVLLRDAAHVFSDALARFLNCAAYRLARRPPSLAEATLQAAAACPGQNALLHAAEHGEARTKAAPHSH